MTVVESPIEMVELLGYEVLPQSADVDLDGLLALITAIKAQQKELDAQLVLLLEQLDQAMAQGRLDPVFRHGNWCFAWSQGRLSYAFPAAIQQQEEQLKAAKEAAIQQGLATEKRGKAFWTIRPAKTELPF
mgnify:CR=1 FL=1